MNNVEVFKLISEDMTMKLKLLLMTCINYCTQFVRLIHPITARLSVSFSQEKSVAMATFICVHKWP